MPPVLMNVDYMRKKKRAQSAKPEETIQRVLKQFSVSPQRFRFTKFNHKKLGVIHPIPSKLKKAKTQTSIPQPATYQYGDKEFMEVLGKKCPITDVEPDIHYTKNDKKQLDEHLVQPFFYVQKLFPKGGQSVMEHDDVFVPFQTLKQSKRKRKMVDEQYIKILKEMNKEERQEFYTKGIRMNVEYAMIFKRFMKGLIKKGLYDQDYKFSTENPKIHKKELLKKGQEMGLTLQKQNQPIQQIEISPKKKRQSKKQKQQYHQIYISKENMMKFLKFCCYDEQFLKSDIDILFLNVKMGDSPKDMLLVKLANMDSFLLDLNAFLHNAQKYFKLKYKIKNLLSVNAAKQRNVYIKFSLYPFLGEGWKAFKVCLKQLESTEKLILSKTKLQQYIDLIQERDTLINMKRVWSKNLQRTPLQYILLKFQKVKDIYVNAINYNAERIDFFNQFQIDLFLYKEQKVDQINNSRFFRNQNISSISLDVRTITLDEVVEFLVEKQFNKEESDQIVDIFQKILKYYGLRKAPRKSKWQLAPEIEPNKILTQQQIVEYLSYYSQKQFEEWKIFKTFIQDFHRFQIKKINLPEGRLQHVRQAWECNIIGEWLIKQLRKLDKSISVLLFKSLEVCKLIEKEGELTDQNILQAMEQDGKCSFDKFINEKTQQQLQRLLKLAEKQQQYLNSKSISIDDWDSDLTKAISNYQVISTKLFLNQQKVQANQKQSPKQQPVQHVSKDQIVSAANFIDDRSIVHDQQQIQVLPQTTQQVSQIIKSPKIEQQNTTLLTVPAKTFSQNNLTKPGTSHDTISRSNLSSNTQMTEAELDMKIQNAMRLQNRIFSELGNIKDLSFRSLK
ncbi:unnamed protein product (macronuclear) [Paramecium tetraurelia]|uniref:Uncharacterized protein n=1 Tax=Paramecium tetraurelia TaxID=5888 RepID=A0E143_PARTE|nr:uncharacterized protein GSPATT00022179001 [Paramecium tetraurelia]CAK89010.1 unnamed protein product [Paramecium tetraurelia]|eukprot:XP_001456407.1 hypothetical protein (macronuclear) [Paramecium tetraurelia strain d4-2]